jgi:two-component system, OmpR family, sensor kinase
VSHQDGRTPDAAWMSAEKQARQAALPDGEGSLSEAPPEVDNLRRQLVELTRENAKLSHENTTLREAVIARDTFLAVAAHELRNPMTPIRGRIQLLRRMLRRDNDKDVLVAKIEKGLEHVEGLIEQYIKRATTLLEVSRATTGQLHLDRVAVELCALVREVAQGLAPIAEHTGSTLEVCVPSDEVLCCGDRLAVEQVVDNLLSNAIKYGEGRPITVSVAEASDLSNTCLVRVRDHGEGISPENQARIFARFERAVHPGEHHGGFGVGLWIVSQLVQAMSGTIEVLSIPGQGSTFTVCLPQHDQIVQES